MTLSFILVNILVTQGTPVKRFVTFKGLISLEAYLIHTECYFSLSLDFLLDFTIQFVFIYYEHRGKGEDYSVC